MIQGQTLIAESPARAAELTETARTLIGDELPGAQELVREFARELERAFQRGAFAGARLEAVSRDEDSFLTWEEVPEVARNLWFLMGLHQFGSSRNPKRWTVALTTAMDVSGKPGWRLFSAVSAKNRMKPDPMVFSGDVVCELIGTGMATRIELPAGAIIVLTPLGERSFKRLNWYR